MSAAGASVHTVHGYGEIEEGSVGGGGRGGGGGGVGFFFNDTATTEIYTLSLHDVLPISGLATREAIFETGLPFSSLGQLAMEIPSEALLGYQIGRAHV